MMTAPAASPQTSRRAPWALWTTLLAMLLAVQVSAGAIRPAALVESGVIAAKLTLPVPLVAQFRETGQALKAAGQRLSTARPHEGHDGTAPPLPSHGLAIATPAAADDPGYFAAIIPPAGIAPVSAYRARAPPLPV